MMTLFAACAANKVSDRTDAGMYTTGLVDPFEGIEHISDEEVPYRGILYATESRL
jgi:hypothetical protein